MYCAGHKSRVNQLLWLALVEAYCLQAVEVCSGKRYMYAPLKIFSNENGFVKKCWEFPWYFVQPHLLLLGDAACTTKNGNPWSYKTGEGSITRRFDQQEFVPEMSGTAHHFILPSRSCTRFPSKNNTSSGSIWNAVGKPWAKCIDIK